MTTIGDLLREKLREKGIELPEVKIKERVHIEKTDKSGPEPKLIETMIIEDGIVVHRQTY